MARARRNQGRIRQAKKVQIKVYFESERIKGDLELRVVVFRTRTVHLA